MWNKRGTSERCSFTDFQSQMKWCHHTWTQTLNLMNSSSRWTLWNPVVVVVVVVFFLWTVIFILLSMNSAGGQISHVAPLCRPSRSRRSSWPRSELRSTLRCRTCGPSACWVTVTASGSSTCPPSSGRRAPRCARCTRRTTSSNTWRTARWCCRTRWDADRVEGCCGFRVLFWFFGLNNKQRPAPVSQSDSVRERCISLVL